MLKKIIATIIASAFLAAGPAIAATKSTKPLHAAKTAHSSKLISTKSKHTVQKTKSHKPGKTTAKPKVKPSAKPSAKPKM